MAPTEGRVARPERRWGCRRGTPVRLSVRDKSEHCENGERHAYGYHVEPIGSQSPLGYSGDASPTPYGHPFPQNWGSQPPVITCIANCGQTVVYIPVVTTVVCTDSLWEHTIALPNSTIVDPLGTPLLQKGGSYKIKFKTAAKS